MRARPGEGAWPLVLFTVLTQAAVGVTVVGAFARPARAFFSTESLALLAVGSVAAALHLGRIGHARFTFSNVRSSWLSREVALAGVFGATLIASLVWPVSAAEIVAAVVGLALVGAIAGIYMIRTVPPWNTWITPATFYLTTILLGVGMTAATLGLKFRETGLMNVAAAAIALQVVFGILHFRRFGRRELRTAFAVRIALAIAGGAVMLAGEEWATTSACILLFGSELAGRHLFYASHRRVGL